jgi:CO/xanthine dehydrogenase FAD-binding subunit
MTTITNYAAPEDLSTAARLLATENTTLLAGGTDLMPQTQAGTKPHAPLLLNLRRIPDLHGISLRDSTIRAGAAVTITEILHEPLLQQHAPVLPATADCFASDQIRNVATLGGNICNASPAGDMIIPLLLLDAEVELVSWADDELQTRRMLLCDFFVGPGQTMLQPQELLAAVLFPIPRSGFVAHFRKFGTRPAMDISVVSVGVGGVHANGSLHKARVALGAVAPIPLRGRQTEAIIEGKPLDESRITEAAEQAAAEISPIDDVRASAWYRRQLVRVLTKRVLRDVQQATD